ncbi:MAG: hypothetical protein WBN89_10880 [Prochlorococcaceae cyanobacterium]
MLASALPALSLLLCCLPPAAHAQLAWQVEADPRRPGPAALPPPTAPSPTTPSPTPGLTASRLTWELEPPASTRPLSSPAPHTAAAPQAAPATVASSLHWKADDVPPPQLAATSGVPADQTASAQPPAEPQLSPEDMEALLLEPYLPPNLGGGVPSAYVANWGDFYVQGSVGTKDNFRDDIDAAFTAGFGLGDSNELIGVELSWNMASFKNFNGNGTFSVAVGRTLVSQPRLLVTLGGGIFDFYSYKNSESSESLPDPTPYGVLTVALPLREPNFVFNQVLQISVGVGGENFAALDSNFNSDDVAPFGAVGVELAPNLGISMGASGRGTNVNLSYTPFREVPIGINVVAADIFDQSPFGPAGVLTVSWGDNFRRGLF